MCTCTRGCIYSCTPDDGCKKHPKHVEQSRSAVIKVTAQLHSVGLFDIDNSCFERVEKFRHLGTKLKNPNYIQEENNCRLKSQNACFDSVQNTVHKTAHLSFTGHLIYPVSLVASIFPYSKQKSTHTHTHTHMLSVCLYEIHSALKEQKLPLQVTIQLPVRAQPQSVIMLSSHATCRLSVRTVACHAYSVTLR